MHLLKQCALLAAAGATGTLCRYFLDLALVRYKSFPWSIGIINLLGCFLFGWVWTFSSKRMLLDTQFRLIALTGFLGAFTTFSTYAFQTLQLLSTGRYLAFAGNIALNNVGGFLMAALGMAIGSR